MILEVNNTFDERRIYFLKDTGLQNGAFGDENGKAVAGKADQDDSQRQNPPPVDKEFGQFAKSWPKDFHVSPFNSRKGAYSLSANDPFFPHLRSRAGAALVNNTITLSSSKKHPKLIARVFSSSDSIDPYTLRGWDISKFIAAWWWVGLVTFPRIVREAGKLFFRRKLHVWFRPEVLKDSIGRNETEDEKYSHENPIFLATADCILEPSHQFSENISRPLLKPQTFRFLCNIYRALPPCPPRNLSRRPPCVTSQTRNDAV